MEYVVLIEQSKDGTFSAHIPDLPGCVAVADSQSEVISRLGEAAKLHVESLREHNEPVPKPTTTSAPIFVM